MSGENFRFLPKVRRFILSVAQTINAMVIHSSFPEFILFLHVHIAKGDSYWDPREIDAIKENGKRLFPEGTDMERKLYEAIRQYKLFDPSRITELLRDSLAHFTNDEATRQTKLFSEVKSKLRVESHELRGREAYHAMRRIVGHA